MMTRVRTFPQSCAVLPAKISHVHPQNPLHEPRFSDMADEVRLRVVSKDGTSQNELLELLHSSASWVSTFNETQSFIRSQWKSAEVFRPVFSAGNHPNKSGDAALCIQLFGRVKGAGPESPASAELYSRKKLLGIFELVGWIWISAKSCLWRKLLLSPRKIWNLRETGLASDMHTFILFWFAHFRSPMASRFAVCGESRLFNRLLGLLRAST